MITKYEWTEEDIKCGRIVCKPSRKKKYEPDGWTTKWTYKIGWCISHPNVKMYKDKNGEYEKNNYCFVAMTDGMIHPPRSKTEAVKWLNENKMIPMPHKWFIQEMDYLKGCYEP